jgi:hypothetical protein
MRAGFFSHTSQMTHRRSILGIVILSWLGGSLDDFDPVDIVHQSLVAGRTSRANASSDCLYYDDDADQFDILSGFDDSITPSALPGSSSIAEPQGSSIFCPLAALDDYAPIDPLNRSPKQGPPA